MGSFLLLLAVTAIASWPVQGHEEINPLRYFKHDKVTVKLEESIKLVASPDTLEKSGSWVKISWSGVAVVDKQDWVGMWLIPNSTVPIDAKKHAPIKYQYCNFSKSHSLTGVGQLSFYLVNMRGLYQFGFFRHGFENPTMVAVSNTVSFKNPNEPLQGHLALTNDISKIILMWVTRDATHPRVTWGTASNTYTRTENAVSSTYHASDMCDTPAMDYGWIDPGMIHRVTMDGLSPATKYYYRFGDDEMSDEYNFYSPPVPGPNVTTKVLTFGDLGHGEYDDSRQVLKLEQPSLNTTKHLISEMDKHDFVLHVGDISYADGYEGIWDEYFDQVKPVLAHLPYMVNPGNHESDSKNSDSFYQGHDSGGECNIPYINRFAMPRPGPDQPWYGFDYGSIHVVMMSTEHDYRNTSKQYSFLDSHLQSVNRSRTPWLILSGHRPMYVDSTNNTEPSGEMPVSRLLIAHIEPLLTRYKVDLAFWGHHHTYQRMCPVVNSVCTEGAPTHIIIGMAGRALLHNLRPEKPNFVAYVDENHWGYSRFVANATTLVFEYIHNDDGKVHDSIVLRKNTPNNRDR